MRDVLVALLDFFGLAGHWRRKLRASLVQLVRSNPQLYLVDAECPECHFLNPIHKFQEVAYCAWCGVVIESERVHG